MRISERDFNAAAAARPMAGEAPFSLRLSFEEAAAQREAENGAPLGA